MLALSSGSPSGIAQTVVGSGGVRQVVVSSAIFESPRHDAPSRRRMSDNENYVAFRPPNTPRENERDFQGLRLPGWTFPRPGLAFLSYSCGLGGSA